MKLTVWLKGESVADEPMGDLAIILKLVKGESVADELQNRLTPRVAAAAPAPTPPRIPRPTPESPLRADAPGVFSQIRFKQGGAHGHVELTAAGRDMSRHGVNLA